MCRHRDLPSTRSGLRGPQTHTVVAGWRLFKPYRKRHTYHVIHARRSAIHRLDVLGQANQFLGDWRIVLIQPSTANDDEYAFRYQKKVGCDGVTAEPDEGELGRVRQSLICPTRRLDSDTKQNISRCNDTHVADFPGGNKGGSRMDDWRQTSRQTRSRSKWIVDVDARGNEFIEGLAYIWVKPSRNNTAKQLPPKLIQNVARYDEVRWLSRDNRTTDSANILQVCDPPIPISVRVLNSSMTVERISWRAQSSTGLIIELIVHLFCTHSMFSATGSTHQSDHAPAGYNSVDRNELVPVGTAENADRIHWRCARHSRTIGFQ